jgi:carboxyl-terminal processing protease
MRQAGCDLDNEFKRNAELPTAMNAGPMGVDLDSGSGLRGRLSKEWRGVRWIGAGMLVLALAPSGFAAPADEAAQSDAVRAFAEAYRQLKSRYAEPLDDRKLVADAIRGMVGGLDPYSYYLDAEAYDGLRQDSSGSFGGLGMEVSMEKNAVRVLSAMDDSPAMRAGLQAGDLITRFDDRSVEGMTLEQAIQQARGEPDTSIALTVLRGDAEPRVVTLKRAVIQSRTVRTAAIDPSYAYFQVSYFNKQTPERLLAAIAAAYEKSGVLKGIVLDLRDNPGGVLRAGVGVASLFLPEDALVVTTQSASEESRMRFTAKDVKGPHGEDYSKVLGTALKSVPLVVLVNGSSASASEIVAGALQSHKRATIVGAKTFGKGTVQVVLPLEGGAAMKVTTAYYYMPDGRRIQGAGVVPDIPVDAPASKAAATPQAAAHACMRALNTAAMPSPSAAADCQLERAVEILRKQPVLVRS